MQLGLRPVACQTGDQNKPASAYPFSFSTRDLGAEARHARLAACSPYHGGITILRNYLKTVRPNAAAPRAFVRMEPSPGERFEIDWGHFGALDYQGDQRKLYAFALVECHSRKQYLEFTHSKASRPSSAATPTPFKPWAV